MVQPNEPPPTFRDRSGRLALFGVLSILVGVGCVGLGLLQAALPLVVRAMPELGRATDTASALAGGVVYLALGAAFAWLGWGSLQRRRWVRPLMLTLAWTWLLGGAISLPLLPLLIPAVLAGGPGGAAAPGAVRAVMLAIGLLVVTFGILLPALFVVVYRDANLRLTCERHDPAPAWTDRCPPRVLGMSIALIGCGVVLVPFAARPAVPLFGTVVGGAPGAALTIATAAACIWSAVALLRRRAGGWWAVTVLLVGLGVSSAITFAAVDASQLFHAIGLPPEMAPDESTVSHATVRRVLVVTAVGLTLATLVYMLRIRDEVDRAG